MINILVRLNWLMLSYFKIKMYLLILLFINFTFKFTQCVIFKSLKKKTIYIVLSNPL